MRYVRVLCVVLCLAGVGIFLLAADAEKKFSLTSPAFKAGAPIPVKYSQKGGNVSPPLVWHNAPKGTRSFALLVEDPDAPHGTWVHWVMFNIPGKVDALPEGIPAKIPADNVAYGAVQGKNSGNHNNYDGPAPPSGVHHYYFRLYALNVAKLPHLTMAAKAADVRAAMKNHLLGTATLMGTYAAQ